MIEFKLAGKSHTIQASVIEALFKRAVRQEKTARYVIHFDSVGLTIEGVVHRE